jgi:hypothetical protein
MMAVVIGTLLLLDVKRETRRLARDSSREIRKQDRGLVYLWKPVTLMNVRPRD